MLENIHVLGIDPGGTTGWCLLTIPRLSIFGDEPSGIVEWDYGEFTGPEPVQAIAVARLAREIQGLDYKVGPAVVTEAWDQDPTFKSTDPEALSPARLNAMFELLFYQKQFADCTITEQGRTMAKHTATNERLEAWGLMTHEGEHIRDATRHAITAVRRAANDPDLALRFWPHAAEPTYAGAF
jgi:hypothetical protein